MSQKYFLRQLIMAANHTESSRFEKRSVMKCLAAEKSMLCDIYRRMSDEYEQACFSQKMFTNSPNMGLPQRVSVEKTLQLRKRVTLTVI